MSKMLSLSAVTGVALGQAGELAAARGDAGPGQRLHRQGGQPSQAGGPGQGTCGLGAGAGVPARHRGERAVQAGGGGLGGRPVLGPRRRALESPPAQAERGPGLAEAFEDACMTLELRGPMSHLLELLCLEGRPFRLHDCSDPRLADAGLHCLLRLCSVLLEQVHLEARRNTVEACRRLLYLPRLWGIQSLPKEVARKLIASSQVPLSCLPNQ